MQPSPATIDTSPLLKHVVLISIDGLRPDALPVAPQLQSMRAQGLYFPTAQTVTPSTTLPAHTSMLTGALPSRHRVYKNKVMPQSIRQPTLFAAAKQHGLSTAMLYAKQKLAYLAKPGTIDYEFGPGAQSIQFKDTSADQLAQIFSIVWPVQRHNFTFIHLREPDLAGHAHGWMSEQYLAAVRIADTAVAKIVQVIEAHKNAGRTAIIVTADHGGEHNKHWGDNNPLHTTIPWLYFEPGRHAYKELARNISVVDTTPTIAALLGFTMPNEIDGVSIAEVIHWLQ